MFMQIPYMVIQFRPVFGDFVRPSRWRYNGPLDFVYGQWISTIGQFNSSGVSKWIFSLFFFLLWNSLWGKVMHTNSISFLPEHIKLYTSQTILLAYIRFEVTINMAAAANGRRGQANGRRRQYNSVSDQDRQRIIEAFESDDGRLFC